MKQVIHVILFLLLCSTAQTQKVYWNSKYPKMNEPVGGVKGLKDLMKKEFVYPVQAIVKDQEGVVTIKYSLDANGTPSITEISGSAHELLKTETKRMFQKVRFPKISHRQPVANSEVFQITFTKKDWVKLSKKRGYKELEYPYTPYDSTQTLYSYQLLREKPYPMGNKNEVYSTYTQYIRKKLQYPEEALKLGLKGEVVITFVVEQSGNITNVQVLQGLGAGCTEEALRLIKKVKWHPGVKDDIAVRTIMISSIGFGVSSNAFKGAFNQGTGGGR